MICSTRSFCGPALLFCFFTVVVAGQQKHLPAIFFRETLMPVVAVSGTVLVGVQYSSTELVIGQSIWASLPPSHNEKLCLSVVSDDGGYNASAEYSLPKSLSGLVMLDFPTSKVSELRKFGTPRIALLGFLQDKCDGTISPQMILLPLSWSSINSSSRLIVKINSGNTDIDLFTRPNGPQVNCTKIGNNDSRVAFDTLCDMTSIAKVGLWSGYIDQMSWGQTTIQTPFSVWVTR